LKRAKLFLAVNVLGLSSFLNRRTVFLFLRTRPFSRTTPEHVIGLFLKEIYSENERKMVRCRKN